MALVLKDRVKETTTTTGTGTITLAGAVTGFQSFSVIGNANTTYYAIVAQTPGEWEVGIGTYTSAGTTLSRDTVLASSNSGSLVVFSAGTKDVWCDYPAGTAVFASNNAGTSGQVLASNGTGVAPSWQNVPATTMTISNKTGAYTVVSGDNGTIINCTSGSFTVSLTAAATLGAGFNCWIWNTSNTATDVITIDPNGAETIDGVATLTLRRGEGTQIVCDGTNWATGAKKTMRGYAENISPTSTRPTATGGGGVALGWGASASGSDSMAAGRSATASGNFAFAGPIGTASANNSVALGMNSGSNGSQAVTGSGAMALGGSYASGTDSFAAAVANNTSSYGATGSNSIAMGYLAKASAASSIALSSNLATASGSGSIAIGGYNYGITASGLISVVIGDDSEATTTGAFALGYGASSSVRGKLAFSGRAISGRGLSQTGTTVIGVATTGATPTVLTSDGGAAATNNQIILPNNSAYAFSALVVARQQAAGGTASAAWKIEGLIRREGTAASTTLVNSAITVLDNTPGWTIAVSADTTNGGLAVTATGAAATNIRWVATVQTSEVTYA